LVPFARLSYAFSKGDGRLPWSIPRAAPKSSAVYSRIPYPDYDAQSMPSADAGSPEPVAFRLGRIERSHGKIAVALEPVVSKT
jgi:hypothetical protein